MFIRPSLSVASCCATRWTVALLSVVVGPSFASCCATYVDLGCTSDRHRHSQCVAARTDKWTNLEEDPSCATSSCAVRETLAEDGNRTNCPVRLRLRLMGLWLRNSGHCRLLRVPARQPKVIRSSTRVWHRARGCHHGQVALPPVLAPAPAAATYCATWHPLASIAVSSALGR